MKLICVGIDDKPVVIRILCMGSNEMMQGFGMALKTGCTRLVTMCVKAGHHVCW